MRRAFWAKVVGRSGAEGLGAGREEGVVFEGEEKANGLAVVLEDEDEDEKGFWLELEVVEKVDLKRLSPRFEGGSSFLDGSGGGRWPLEAVSDFPAAVWEILMPLIALTVPPFF